VQPAPHFEANHRERYHTNLTPTEWSFQKKKKKEDVMAGQANLIPEPSKTH